jgi:hypothetical protein
VDRACLHRDPGAGGQPRRRQGPAAWPGGGAELRPLQHRGGLGHRQGPASHGGSLRRGCRPRPGGGRLHLGRRHRGGAGHHARRGQRGAAAGIDRRYQGILAVTDEPLVSADIIKDPRASIVQLDLTRVVGGNLVKVMSWYDNEWGFTNQMVQVAVQQLDLDTHAKV